MGGVILETVMVISLSALYENQTYWRTINRFTISFDLCITFFFFQGTRIRALSLIALLDSLHLIASRVNRYWM